MRQLKEMLLINCQRRGRFQKHSCSITVEQAKSFDDNKKEKMGLATTYSNIEHLLVLFARNLSSEEAIGETMAGQETSWADQWGPGGMGAMEDDPRSNAKKDDKGKKAKRGFTKAKEAALLGTHKLRSSTLNGVNWIKKQSQKKNSSTNKQDMS